MGGARARRHPRRPVRQLRSRRSDFRRRGPRSGTAPHRLLEPGPGGALLGDPDGAHDIRNRAYADQAFARLRTLLPPSFHAVVADIENICEEERQLARQKTLHLWLHGWLLTHVPLSFALLALAVVHIFMALRY